MDSGTQWSSVQTSGISAREAGRGPAAAASEAVGVISPDKWSYVLWTLLVPLGDEVVSAGNWTAQRRCNA